MRELMSADFFVLLKFCWYILCFKRTTKIIFQKCQKLITKCFKVLDCFQSLHCIVDSIIWFERLKNNPIACKYSEILNRCWTNGFNSFINGSNNHFIRLIITLLLLQHVKAILSWVWRDPKNLVVLILLCLWIRSKD